MRDQRRYVVWRRKGGHAWEQVTGPMSRERAGNEAQDRMDRSKALGSAYEYMHFVEGNDPNN